MYISNAQDKKLWREAERRQAGTDTPLRDVYHYVKEQYIKQAEKRKSV